MILLVVEGKRVLDTDTGHRGTQTRDEEDQAGNRCSEKSPDDVTANLGRAKQHGQTMSLAVVRENVRCSN